jgi:hypothetical protein
VESANEVKAGVGVDNGVEDGIDIGVGVNVGRGGLLDRAGPHCKVAQLKCKARCSLVS